MLKIKVQQNYMIWPFLVISLPCIHATYAIKLSGNYLQARNIHSIGCYKHTCIPTLPFGCWIILKGRHFISFCTRGSSYFRPRSRLKPYKVFFMFVTIWFFAATPRIRFFPLRATHDLKRQVLEQFIGISKHNTVGTIKHFRRYIQHCSTCIHTMWSSSFNSQLQMLGTYAMRLKNFSTSEFCLTHAWRKIWHIWIGARDALEQIHCDITIFLPPDTFRNCYATVSLKSVNESVNCTVEYSINLLCTSFRAELAATCVELE
jgi:hypothetical protein